MPTAISISLGLTSIAGRKANPLAKYLQGADAQLLTGADGQQLKGA